MRWESYDLGKNQSMEEKERMLGKKVEGKQCGNFIFKTEHTTLPSHSQIQVKAMGRLRCKLSVYSLSFSDPDL